LLIVKYCMHLFINLPGPSWSDADITELLSFRRRSILAGDLNAKHPFWNSSVSNPSGEKLMALFDLSEFEISAPQYPTHYSPAANGDVLDIVVHQNISVRCHCLGFFFISDHLPIIYHILDHVKIRNLSDLLKNSQIGIGCKSSPRN
jgi:hypothetical protein